MISYLEFVLYDLAMRKEIWVRYRRLLLVSSLIYVEVWCKFSIRVFEVFLYVEMIFNKILRDL